MTETAGWIPAENGATLGHTGSEGGVIGMDEEHTDGARITLECPLPAECATLLARLSSPH